MKWPTGLDYTEIVQSPQTAFENADLRTALPECRPPNSGIPYGRSGNFATVFKLKSPSGNWAVKCFTREPQDSSERYAAISECLSKLCSPYMVDFSYLHRGIRFCGQWYPVVKMQWADGDPLDVYVRKNLANSQVLADLAVKWAQMVQALERSSIAHGDLQHGNVLVVNSRLKLVDYDGMFVPTLAGRRSNELGQPNYQHPHRTEADFGPYLDKFSAWVIYVSLVALSLYPHLWQTFRGGDDCLLFRKQDFENPEGSPLFKTLEHCNSQQLRDLVEFFKVALFSLPSDVPGFDNVVETQTVIGESATRSAIPNWLQDHIEPKPTRLRQEPATPNSSDQSWVLDFISPAEPGPRFVSNIILQRILLYACLAGALSSALLSSFGTALVAFVLLIFTTVASIRRYRKEPAVELRQESQALVHKLERELVSIREVLSELDVKKHDLRIAESQHVETLMKEIQTVFDDEKKQRDSLDRTTRQATVAALQAKQRIDQAEAAEIKQIQSTLGNSVSNLTQQLNRSAYAESVERSSTLQKKQQEYVQHQLEHIEIEGAIPGIGGFLTSNLEAAGIRTAADCFRLTYVKVSGVGPRRVAAILAWWHGLETRARLTMPSTLSAHEETTIKSKYEAQRTQLQGQLLSAEQALKTAQTAVQQKHANSRAPFDSQIALEKSKQSVELQRIATESRKRQESLYEAVRRTKQKANDAVNEAQKDEPGHRQMLKALQWKLAKAKMQRGRFEMVTFRRYIRRVAIG